MAKKSSVVKNDSIYDLVNSIDGAAEVLADSKTAVISDYISTGNYILNACMTGSLFKGAPCGRVLTLAGAPGCLPKGEKVEIYVLENESGLHNIKSEKDVTLDIVEEDDSSKFKLNRKCILRDLKSYFTYCEFERATGFGYDYIPDDELRGFYNTHCKLSSVVVNIEELHTTYKDKVFLISTPDGFVPVGDLYLKNEREIYKITAKEFELRCAEDHLVETYKGWKAAKDLTLDDEVYTKQDYVKLDSIIKEGKEEVYDLEVLHPNHRYWAGNGISSHNSGKSFLALSICREAQKKGYVPVYMDSEGAIDKEFVERLGCDSQKFIIKQVTTISEVSTFVANFCQKLLEMPENKRYKAVMVLDSLGNLTSSKELNDTIEGNSKRDMTKQQEIKALFRTNMTALSKLSILFIVNSHVYSTQDLFSKQIVSGGCLVPDELVITSKGNKRISDIEIGDRVLTHDGTFKDVLETFRFRRLTTTLDFDDCSTIECSDEHKFLIDYTAPEKDESWKLAFYLKKGDIIYTLTDDNDYAPLTIVNKEHSTVIKPVCDLCVEDNHTYVSANKIINHNSGIAYNSSLTVMLSTAKLDDKESDKIIEKKTGDYVKTGVLVTARPEKSRFTIPQKVKFQIPFFKKPNPFVGLEPYITWDNSGILRGKCYNQTEFEKLSESEQSICKEFEFEGKTLYAFPKENSKYIVVKHLGGEVPLTELFTAKVITDEILKKLDDEVIRPSFELPSQASSDDLDEFILSEMGTEDEDE